MVIFPIAVPVILPVAFTVDPKVKAPLAAVKVAFPPAFTAWARERLVADVRLRLALLTLCETVKAPLWVVISMSPATFRAPVMLNASELER